MKEQILILSIVLLPFGVMAEWSDCGIDEETNCEWQISDGVLTVRPKAGATDVAIPDYTRDCTMTKSDQCTTPAPWRWDNDESSIHTVNIENGITSLGAYAFEDMEMTTVHLPDGVTSIASSFIECYYLSNVNLPDSLRNIGRSAFAYTSLENIVIPEGTPENPTIVGQYAFNRNPYIKSLVVGENTMLDSDVFMFPSGYANLDFNNFSIYCAQGNTTCNQAVEKALIYEQSEGLIDSSAQVSDYLTIYTKDTSGQFYQIDDKLYATADLMTHNAACDDAANCQAILDAASQGKPFEVGGKYYATLDLFASGAACTDKQNCEDILASNGNPFKVGSKIYNSMADFANGNYVKHRIYTIEEANFVAGPVNRVSIRYR
ncbi:MAG: leucine-rich repeat domain-containing protein [Alphaproteobacteria bacterium]|nr:leucine-rich repeat domain-containing protein [Alphaproteobacteria bacterium]